MTSPEPDAADTVDRCVVCHLSDPRHGGLCCAHRYGEQPRCAECPPATAARPAELSGGWPKWLFRAQAVVVGVCVGHVLAMLGV